MALDLGSARHWARALQAQALPEGGVCVDATMGNGGDTEALCRLAGPEGRVYAFDVQEQALRETRARLEAQGLDGRVRLFLAGHERMDECVKEPVNLVVFNLGWLPGAPDKGVTTRCETTLQAIAKGLTLLVRGGLVTLCVYPGHEEGARELAAIEKLAASLDPRKYQSLVKRYLNQPPQAPCLIAIQKVRE